MSMFSSSRQFRHGAWRLPKDYSFGARLRLLADHRATFRAREKLSQSPACRWVRQTQRAEDDVERLFASVGEVVHIVSTARRRGGVYVPV